MTADRDRSRLRAPLLASSLLLVVAAPLTAPLTAQDFKFGRPWVTIAAYGGWSWPGESSEIFDFTRDQLTVGSGDFAAPLIGAEVALRLTERLDLAVGVEHASRTVASEDRRYVYQDDRPILQETEFQRTRLMGSVKAYLFERGRTISRYAWVPQRWSPYIGGGAGIGWYDFTQEGDFVDYQTLDIFEDRFRSSGSGTTVHAMAGVDVTLSRSFILRGEFRQIWGDADMDARTFEGFDDIDLSDSRLVLGVAIR